MENHNLVLLLHNYSHAITVLHSLFYIINSFSNKISTGFVSTTENKVSIYFFLEQNLFLWFYWFYFLIYLKSLYESYLPSSTLFLILFFNHPIWNQFSFLPLHSVVASFVSDNGLSVFVLFVASIQYYNYRVKYFRLNSFILSTVCFDTISTIFFSITKNEVSLIYVLKQNLFLIFDWFCFLIHLKSFYESHLPLSTLFIILFFNYSIKNQLYAATSYHLLPSHKLHQAIPLSQAVSASMVKMFLQSTPPLTPERAQYNQF